MKPLTNILVGIDYSECSRNALREASRLSNWNNATLRCHHVLDEEVVARFRKNNQFDERRVLDESLRRLEDYIADTVGAGHRIRCSVAVGHPLKNFLSIIESSGADLIVLGSHGLHSDDPGRTGTFASHCVRRAPVDTLLVRRDQDEPFRSILACIDFSETSRRAASLASGIARQDKAQLELLHIYRSPNQELAIAGAGELVLPLLDTTAITGDLRRDLDQIAADLPGFGDPPAIRTTVEEHFSIARGILERARKVEADLVVFGTRGHNRLYEFFLGTTAEYLIHRASCSVLSIRPE